VQHESMSVGAGESLEQAQLNKLDALVAMAGITKEDHVLEIGCGWGSMAIRAVQVGLPPKFNTNPTNLVLRGLEGSMWKAPIHDFLANFK